MSEDPASRSEDDAALKEKLHAYLHAPETAPPTFWQQVGFVLRNDFPADGKPLKFADRLCWFWFGAGASKKTVSDPDYWKEVSHEMGEYDRYVAESIAKKRLPLSAFGYSVIHQKRIPWSFLLVTSIVALVTFLLKN